MQECRAKSRFQEYLEEHEHAEFQNANLRPSSSVVEAPERYGDLGLVVDRGVIRRAGKEHAIQIMRSGVNSDPESSVEILFQFDVTASMCFIAGFGAVDMHASLSSARKMVLWTFNVHYRQLFSADSDCNEHGWALAPGFSPDRRILARSIAAGELGTLASLERCKCPTQRSVQRVEKYKSRGYTMCTYDSYKLLFNVPTKSVRTQGKEATYRVRRVEDENCQVVSFEEYMDTGPFPGSCSAKRHVFSIKNFIWLECEGAIYPVHDSFNLARTMQVNRRDIYLYSV